MFHRGLSVFVDVAVEDLMFKDSNPKMETYACKLVLELFFRILVGCDIDRSYKP